MIYKMFKNVQMNKIQVKDLGNTGNIDVFVDMIANVISNKRKTSIVFDISFKGKNLNIYFIVYSFFIF